MSLALALKRGGFMLLRRCAGGAGRLLLPSIGSMSHSKPKSHRLSTSSVVGGARKFEQGKLPKELLQSLVLSHVGAKDDSVIVGPAIGEDSAIIRIQEPSFIRFLHRLLVCLFFDRMPF